MPMRIQGLIRNTDGAIDREITEGKAQEHVWMADLIIGLDKSGNYIIMAETDQMTCILQIISIIWMPVRMQGFRAINDKCCW